MADIASNLRKKAAEKGYVIADPALANQPQTIGNFDYRRVADNGSPNVSIFNPSGVPPLTASQAGIATPQTFAGFPARQNSTMGMPGQQIAIGDAPVFRPTVVPDLGGSDRAAAQPVQPQSLVANAKLLPSHSRGQAIAQPTPIGATIPLPANKPSAAPILTGLSVMPMVDQRAEQKARISELTNVVDVPMYGEGGRIIGYKTEAATPQNSINGQSIAAIAGAPNSPHYGENMKTILSAQETQRKSIADIATEQQKVKTDAEYKKAHGNYFNAEADRTRFAMTPEGIAAVTAGETAKTAQKRALEDDKLIGTLLKNSGANPADPANIAQAKTYVGNYRNWQAGLANTFNALNPTVAKQYKPLYDTFMKATPEERQKLLAQSEYDVMYKTLNEVGRKRGITPFDIPSQPKFKYAATTTMIPEENANG